jgi:hypothetical protein
MAAACSVHTCCWLRASNAIIVPFPVEVPRPSKVGLT